MGPGVIFTLSDALTVHCGKAELLNGLRNPTSRVGIAKFGCREVWNYFREVIPLTHSE